MDLSVLNCSRYSSAARAIPYAPVLRRKHELALFIQDSSISSKLFSLDVQYKGRLLLIQCYYIGGNLN